MSTSLDGFNIVVSQMMAGAKKAVKSGNTVYVSPAMFDLMSKEDGPGLKHLLENLPCIDIGEYDFYDVPPVVSVPQ